MLFAHECTGLTLSDLAREIMTRRNEGPCKMIAPIPGEIAVEYHDRLRIAKLNIDENPQTPLKFGIRGIPTLILFKNGTVEAQKVGALSKSQLAAFLELHL